VRVEIHKRLLYEPLFQGLSCGKGSGCGNGFLDVELLILSLLVLINLGLDLTTMNSYVKQADGCCKPKEITKLITKYSFLFVHHCTLHSLLHS
jgi:hypothetical protein